MSKYECKFCNYKTSRKHDFNKHMGTKRHLRNSQNKDLTPSATFSQPATNLRLFSPPKSSEILQNSLNCEKVAKISSVSPPKSSDWPSDSPPKSSEILRSATFFCDKNSEKSQNIHFSPHFPHNIQKVYNSPQNIHYLSEDNDENDINESQLTCEYCNKRFSRIDNYNRHVSSRCKIKKKRDQDEKYMLETLKNEKERMIQMHEKEKEEFRKHIEKLLDKVGTTNITNTNCGNTQTNNVQLNNFGQEDLTMLTDKYMNKMVAYPYSAIPKMIKKIHFNDQYPANRNIRMLNKKDNKLQIRNNGEWQYVNKKETLQLLIEDKNYQLENYYENNKEKFDATKQDRFENFQNQVNIEDKKATDSIKKDTELVFWNSM